MAPKFDNEKFEATYKRAQGYDWENSSGKSAQEIAKARSELGGYGGEGGSVTTSPLDVRKFHEARKDHAERYKPPVPAKPSAYDVFVQPPSAFDVYTNSAGPGADGDVRDLRQVYETPLIDDENVVIKRRTLAELLAERERG